MSYHKQRLEHDSEIIRTQVTQLGRVVEAALRNAVKSLLTRDIELAYRTIIGDHPINRAAEALDRDCHYFIARHLPSAGHLRFISSAMKMNLLLERMGDYAATIARESAQLSTPLAGTFRAEIEAMAADALQMFDWALTAYETEDQELARNTMRIAKQVDRDYLRAFKLLTRLEGEGLDTADLFGCLIIISRLERVSDQAKNICEETLFSLTGETKKRGPMRVIFLEQSDDCFAPIAVAVGRRFFPARGIFSSAGSNPAPSVRNDVISFLDEHGLTHDGLLPSRIDWNVDGWRGYDVIVSLNGLYRDYLEEVPFLSVAFDWWLPSGEDDSVDLTEGYRFLHSQIEELMMTLRGKAESEA